MAPQIPVYVGPWIVAAQDMRTYLKKMDSPTASALMIYPHDSTVADFRLYARSLLGDKADQVIIATNQEAEATQGPFYDYIALTDRTPDALYDSLRNKAGFLLRLLTVPSYHEAGGSRMQWASADSVRYAQEWRFWTGGLLTEAEANTIAKRGEGPTARRLCHGVGSFIALQAEAEYPWDGKNTDAKLSLA